MVLQHVPFDASQSRDIMRLGVLVECGSGELTTIIGDDTAGRTWRGELRGNVIYWTSDDGLSGTEVVKFLSGGRMRGISATGDVKCCYYSHGRWVGDCPDGEYQEDE